MITISTCMIVKNEELVLARCLDCVKRFSDEIIIVDTGSSDKTKEVAANYTDKIYDFAWINDFSAARNYSFSKASCDYIYTADADEIIDENNIQKILQLKEAILPEIDIVQMYYTNQLEFGTTYNYDMEYRPKLMKRLREFYWVDPLHETLRLEPVIYDSDIAIIHKPHENHSDRDFSNLQKLIQNGDKLSSKLNIMYAKELFISGTTKDFLTAQPYYQSLMDEILQEDELYAALSVIAKCAAIRKDAHLMLCAAAKSMAGGEPSAEICTCLGEYYMSCEEYEEAAMWFYNAAYEAECRLAIPYGHALPLQGLIRCYQIFGNEEQVAFYEQELRKED